MVACLAALDLPHARVEWVIMPMVTREGDRRCKQSLPLQRGQPQLKLVYPVP
ncbi:hypothetical protein EES42_14140 [Streptomyces sp. ADI95-17]|nr:hypothetical protein EES42_14140 [Streptomyces sp. ADI95-17]